MNSLGKGATVPIALLIRLITIPLGILSALALARDGLGFKLLPFLDAIITAYGLLLDDLLLEIVLAIFEPVLNVLKTWFDWNWNLYPHWKHTFVLLWLYYASALRSAMPERLNPRRRARIAFRWASSAIIALIGGVCAGTAPIDQPAVLWWPVAMYFLFAAVDHFVFAFRSRKQLVDGLLALAVAVPFMGLAAGWIELPIVAGPSPLFWWAIAGYFAYGVGTAVTSAAFQHQTSTHLAGAVMMLAIAATAVALGLGVLPGPEWLTFRLSPSPGLANLVAFVVIIACWHAFFGLLALARGHEGFLLSAFRSPRMRLALDILAVIGGAAIIVYLAQLMA